MNKFNIIIIIKTQNKRNFFQFNLQAKLSDLNDIWNLTVSYSGLSTNGELRLTRFNLKSRNGGR